jgi:DNA repair protein RecO (recombination protein O)
MEETYNIKAIVLNRADFRENDSRVTLYSRERGKMSLVARGARKVTSKLSSHIEAATLADIMVVVGKNMNYVGGVVSRNCYANIKRDFSKLQICGEALRFFDKIVKPDLADVVVFKLLEDFLVIMNDKDISFFDDANDEDENFLHYRIFLYAFLIKLLAILGYQPSLGECVVCKKNILENDYKMDYLNGGLVCKEHSKQGNATVSNDVIKFLRLLFDNNLEDFIKYKIKKEHIHQFIETIKTFIKYQNIA